MKLFIAILVLVFVAHAQAAYMVTNTSVGTPGQGIMIRANQTAPPTITNTITLSCWAYHWATNAVITEPGQLIVKGKTLPTASLDCIYSIRYETNHLQFRYTPGGVSHIWGVSVAETLKVPKHIAVTFTFGTGSSLKFYLDGIPVSGSWVAGDGNTVPTENANTVQIGTGNASGFQQYFGLLSEVAIWSSILTPAEISILAKSKLKRMPLQISKSTLVMYVPLDDYRPLKTGAQMPYAELAGRMTVGDSGAIGVGWYEVFCSYPPNE